MESHLGSIPGVVVYLDDILITGPSEQENWTHWRQCMETSSLQRLQDAGLKLQKDKCVQFSPEGAIADGEQEHVSMTGVVLSIPY